MDKKQLHHLWTRIRSVKIWYLALATIVSIPICVLSLRANNLHMIALRDQVYEADKNNGDVNGALRKLQSYVYAHMNTSLTTGNDSVYPPIQLKYTYERLQQAAKAQAQQDNAAIYTQAQKFCEHQDATDFSGRNRVPCIEQYVTSHGVAPKAIPDAMYKFDFTSASWSPDLAGFSLIVASAWFVLLVLRAIAGYAAKRFL